MNRQEILQKVIDVITDQISVDAEDIDENTSLEDDLEVDSLDLLQIVTAIEDEFGVTIEDEVFGTVKTIGDALDYLEKLI